MKQLKKSQLRKIEAFKQAMIRELTDNAPNKGDIENFRDFNGIITELEYHKAKMMVAIRCKEKQAIKEYIADTANFLFQLGNLYQLYEPEFKDKAKGESFEINKNTDIFVKTTHPQTGQNIQYFYE